MNDLELLEIQGGGFKIGTTFLNSFSRAINTMMDFGRTVGTSIRMIMSGQKC